MRALFFAFVLALCAVAAAALAAPRVINRPATQAQLQELVEAATGAELLVRGRIVVDALPRPRLILVRTGLRGLADGVEVDADRIDLAISPLALLRGRLVVHEVRLVRPRLRTSSVTSTGALELLARTIAREILPDLDGVTVLDGRVDVEGSAEAGLGRLREIDVQAQREPAASRIVVTASARGGTGEPVRLQAELRQPAGGGAGSVQVELVRGPEGNAGRIDFRGFGALAGGAPSLRGALTVEATSLPALSRVMEPVMPITPPPGLQPMTPIALTGRLTLDDEAVRLTEIDLRLGSTPIRGEAAFTASSPPRLDVSLEAAELSADELADTRLLAALRSTSPPPGVVGRIAMRAQAVHWRGGTARDARLELGLDGAGRIAMERASLRLPGGGDAYLSGTLNAGSPAWRFDGRMILRAEDSDAAARFVGAHLPLPLPPGLDLSAGLRIADGQVSLQGIRGRLGPSGIAADVVWTVGERPRLAVTGSVDRWTLPEDLARAMPPSVRRGLIEALRPIDLEVDVAVERTLIGLVRAERGRLRLGAERGSVRLHELSVESLEDARLNVVGSAALDGGPFALAAELHAPRPTLLLRALGAEVPPTAVRFGPVRLVGSLKGDAAGSDIEVVLNARGLRASLAGSTGAGLDTGRLDLVAEAVADDPWAVLRHAGVAAIDGPPGAARARLRLQRVGSSGTLTIDAGAASGRLEAALAMSGLDGRPRVDGRVLVPRLQPDLTQALLQLAPTDLPSGLQNPALVLGRLPSMPLPWEWMQLADADLEVELHSAQDLRFNARLADGHLAVSGIEATIAGGRMSGTLTLDANKGAGSLGAELDVVDARAASILQGVGFGRGVGGAADMHLQLAGSGRSLTEIVGDLAGRGRVALRDGRLEMPSHRLEQVTAEGELHVDRGIVTAAGPGLALRYPNGAGRLSVRFDLLAWIAETAVEAAAIDGSGPIAWSAIGTPGRLQSVPAAP